jgi:hypothetical protein
MQTEVNGCLVEEGEDLPVRNFGCFRKRSDRNLGLELQKEINCLSAEWPARYHFNDVLHWSLRELQPPMRRVFGDDEWLLEEHCTEFSSTEKQQACCWIGDESLTNAEQFEAALRHMPHEQDVDIPADYIQILFRKVDAFII